MDLSILIRPAYNIYLKTFHYYVILLKFGDKSLTSLAKLVLEAKTSICSTTKVLSQAFGNCCRCDDLT